MEISLSRLSNSKPAPFEFRIMLYSLQKPPEADSKLYPERSTSFWWRTEFARFENEVRRAYV